MSQNMQEPYKPINPRYTPGRQIRFGHAAKPDREEVLRGLRQREPSRLARQRDRILAAEWNKRLAETS